MVNEDIWNTSVDVYFVIRYSAHPPLRGMDSLTQQQLLLFGL